MASRWQLGHDSLTARQAAIPAALRQAASLEIAFQIPAARRVVTTGIGSSAAHAKFLAHLLDEACVSARFLPAGALPLPPRDAARDALIVFSQGLSPNARLALAHPQAWARVVLVTGIAGENSRFQIPNSKFEDGEPEAARIAARRAAEEAGVHCIALPGGPERGTLLRLVGPMAGYVVAHRLAAAVARAAGATVLPALDIDRILERVDAAAARGTALVGELGDGALFGPLAFLASGGYGELADNLRLKVLEGALQPAPPVWDLLDFAHGPYQALADGPATLFALTRAGAPMEAELLGRLAGMLDPARHRLVRLEATLPGPLAILEHETQLNMLVLHAIAARQIDQVDWPGKAREQSLYDVAAPLQSRIRDTLEPEARSPKPSLGFDADPRRHRLDELTWPELEARLARGHRTAVLPLGATEQHGPHLPFATDTWIADAVAARFCARVPGATALPTLPLGCSSEHAAFAGTLDLQAATLRAVLRDVVTSLGRHGFETIVVFSAHGGNFDVLRAAERDLAAAAAPAALLVFTDLEHLVAVWHSASAASGIAPAAAGHHAGEFETSILAGLRPEQVRRDRLAPGLLDVPDDAQAIFHPSLRRHAPSGVVGDPRHADASRADRYLDAWADALVEWYRGAKNLKNTNGTQKP